MRQWQDVFMESCTFGACCCPLEVCLLRRLSRSWISNIPRTRRCRPSQQYPRDYHVFFESEPCFDLNSNTFRCLPPQHRDGCRRRPPTDVKSIHYVLLGEDQWLGNTERSGIRIINAEQVASGTNSHHGGLDPKEGSAVLDYVSRCTE